MRITRNQIQRWACARKVPYEAAAVEPTSAPFWKAVSEVLSTAVRLDPPKAMDPMDELEAESEWLFEAVVQPTQPQERQVRRIDSAINDQLVADGALAASRAVPRPDEFAQPVHYAVRSIAGRRR